MHALVGEDYKVYAGLIKHTDSTWVAMNNWGWTERSAVPSIVINVKDRKGWPWNELMDKILQFCDDIDAPHFEVAMENEERL